MWASQPRLFTLYRSNTLPTSLLDRLGDSIPLPQELLRSRPEMDSYVFLATDGFVYKVYNLLHEDAAAAFANERRVYEDEALEEVVLPNVSVSTLDGVGIIKMPHVTGRSLTHMSPQGMALIKNTDQGSPDALLSKTIPSPYVDKAKQLIKKFHQLGFSHNDIHGGNIVVWKDDSLRLIDFESSVKHHGEVARLQLDRLKFLTASGGGRLYLESELKGDSSKATRAVFGLESETPIIR